jgi:hypothetical protein
MLIGPMQPADNAGRCGGAAGNRTRVQSAYYVRVYLHSPDKSEPTSYRPKRLPIEEGRRQPGETA